jgi:protein-S-isoprenylcysteine O-methyltransferase Ste14
MAPASIFKIIFVLSWILAETIRFPHRMRNKVERRNRTMQSSRVNALDVTLDLLAFTGLQVLPLIYVFTPWLSFADYLLPAWAGWLGVLVMGASLALLWRAHNDLGTSWSPTVEISQEHHLVTHGIYAVIRHPIYAAMWLWAIAQALLLPNWLGGLSGLALFLLVYLYRTPREERMMLDQYGDAYRQYSQRTGGVLPRLWGRS